jgi:hypothetical protein
MRDTVQKILEGVAKRGNELYLQYPLQSFKLIKLKMA